MYIVYTSSHVAGAQPQPHRRSTATQHHRPGYGKACTCNCADGTCLFPRDCQGMIFSFLPS